METFEIVLVILGLLMVICALLFSYSKGCLNGLMQAKENISRYLKSIPKTIGRKERTRVLVLINYYSFG